MRDKQTMLLLRHTVSLFGKRHTGALQCWDDLVDKISSLPRRSCDSLSHSLCSFLTVFGGKHHFISKWCQSFTCTHMVWTPGLLLVPTYTAVRSISKSGPYSRCCAPVPCYAAARTLLAKFFFVTLLTWCHYYYLIGTVQFWCWESILIMKNSG